MDVGVGVISVGVDGSVYYHGLEIPRTKVKQWVERVEREDGGKESTEHQHKLHLNLNQTKTAKKQERVSFGNSRRLCKASWQ